MLRSVFARVPGLFGGTGSARDSALEQSLRKAHAAGQLDDLHCVLVRGKDEILAELYFEGEDQRWSESLGLRRHGPDTLHDLRSISKVVVSLLYGIALDRGQVAPPDAPLLAQFPEHADLSDPERNRITVADALTMRMGIAWNEALPYTDLRNSEVAMELSGDRYRYVLEQPMTETPGQTWVYNGGATALLGGLIQRGTGQALDQFAREVLFAPLGITNFEWVTGADGVPVAASGLRMTARDLARIGELIVAGGMHDGQQVVRRNWLDTSLAPRTTPDPLRYGYHWWLSTEGDPPNWVAGFGHGGQCLSISLRQGQVVVVLAGRYDDPEPWTLPVAVIIDHIAPVLGPR